MFPCIFNTTLSNANFLYCCPLEKPVAEFPSYFTQEKNSLDDNSLNGYPSLKTNLKPSYEVLNLEEHGDNYPLNKIMEQIGKIWNGKNLLNIRPGDWVFFGHVNQLTHLAIAKFQEFLNLGSLHNLTHVGFVTNVLSKNHFEIAESPGFGLPLKKTVYNIEDLHDDEELLFATPPSGSDHLGGIMHTVGQNWVSPLDDTSNHYNVKGLFTLPFSEQSFTHEDKRDLINAFADYILAKSPPQLEKDGILSDKPYFCSEFTQEATQFGRFLQMFPSISEMMKDEIEKYGFDITSANGREQIVRYLESRWEHFNLWEELLQDPLFSIPARVATPGSLFDLALRHSSAIRIRNEVAKPRYVESELTPEVYPKYIEYLSTRLLNRYLKGEEISPSDKDVEKLVRLLENEMHYSQETLNCFIQTCRQVNTFSTCTKSCLENTLTWQEKLTIYFISREINRAVEEMLHNPLLLEFLQNPYDLKWRNPAHLSLLELNVEKALDIFFPVDIRTPLKSAENVFAKHLMKSLDTSTLFKYIPLSLAYAPPSQEITKLLNEENIPTEKLANHLFNLFLLVQTKKDPGSFDQMQRISKLVLNSGLIQTDQPWMNRIVDDASKKSGYSADTLKCAIDSLPDTENLNNKIEKCLMDTLSIFEKVNVYLSHQMIVQAVESLIRNNAFREFMHKGTVTAIPDQYSKEEALLNIFFPTDALSYIGSIKNYAARSFCSLRLKQGLSQFIFKDVFLGLAYDPEAASGQIKNFLVEENISQAELLEKIYKFLKNYEEN